MSFHFAIDMPIRGRWENVQLLRTSVESCLNAVFQDVGECRVLATVAGELLENAIKYGDRTKQEENYRMRVAGDLNRITVSVSNPVVDNDPGVAEVLKTVEWIKSFPSAAEAYRARLFEISQRPRGGAPVSKLGLVRIAYEGGEISASVTHGILNITVELAIATP